MVLIKLRVIFSIINVVYFILRRILLFLHKKPPSIPSITDSLFMLSATTLAKKIRQKEVTCYEVMHAYIERIKKVNPFINAVVDNRFTDALIEAKICDEQLKADKFDIATLEKEKPLYGVPLSIKECCALKGCSHSGCTLALKGTKATSDAIVIELLRNAGAIPLCITNTPEMCSGFDSMNLVYGRTYNPYDARYIAGGSSGGEGALLGAGASVIGIGSDLAGSIRIPSSFNGVFGHKPTAGIIPTAGHFPYCEDKFFQMLLTFGPMTRYAEDLNLIMKVLTSRYERNLHLNAPVNLKQLKVYYRQGLDKSFGLLPIVPEIKECVLKAANHFTQYGIPVEKLPIEWPATLTEIALAMILNIKETPQILIDINDPKLQKNSIIEMGKALFGLSQHTLQAIFYNFVFEKHFFLESNIAHYTKKGEAIRQKLLDVLGEDGVFIYPTFRGPAVVENLFICEILSVPYCSIFNIFGFPAVHVPMGLNSEGLPIGVQVIAAPYQDRLCLAVAKELETAFGGWVPPSVSIRD